MRFRAQITNITTLTRFASSLATLGHIAWVRLNDTDCRFTVIPEKGSQVWSVLSPDSIFEEYTIQSAAEENAINLEVPLAELVRALRSAGNGGTGASVRLTKRDGMPVLRLSITTTTTTGGGANAAQGYPPTAPSSTATFPAPSAANDAEYFDGGGRRERETLVTQDIPIRVLAPQSVEGLHEPRCRDPDVHIVLPNLLQLKSISDRFTKLALASKSSTGGGRSKGGFLGGSAGGGGPKLELKANMHGCLRLSLHTDSLNISSLWTGLENPELDPEQTGQEGLANHPSTRMKGLGNSTGLSDEGWATVRVEGRDWGRVLSVGRLGGRVIACFCDENALILYVFLSDEGGGRGESVLTYYISSYST
ncbi:Hus1-like protein [Hortaea werneckii]|nr:Hus1-like protein [Hortaea werneckii]KAI7714667.1 Hus1-like protein [Hortaea werneckii]